MEAQRYLFRPNFSVLAQLQPIFPIKDFEKEHGVYSATPEFVRKHCGDIGRMVLESVPDWYYAEADALGLYPNCDVRVHRLYPGDYPAYPGWHCDGEFRETYFSQPDLNKIKVHKHLICTISTHETGVSNTQFLTQDLEAYFEKVDSEHTLWGQVHSLIESNKYKRTVDTKDGQLVCFDSWTLHRAMPTKVRGWRLFFRMSMWHKKNLGDGGMITKQEQVYKVLEGSGW